MNCFKLPSLTCLRPLPLLMCILLPMVSLPLARADGMPDAVPRGAWKPAAVPTNPGGASAATGLRRNVPPPPAGAPQATGLDAPMTVDLRQVTVSSALRLIAEASGTNLVATQQAADRELSMYMADTTAGAVLDALSRATGLWYRWRPQSKSYLVMTAEEFQRDVVVFREERTEVLQLRQYNVVAAAAALRGLFGDRVKLQAPVEEPLGENMQTTDLRRGQNGSSGNNSSNRNNTGNSRNNQTDLNGQSGLTTSTRGGSRGAGISDPGLAASATVAGAGLAQAEAASNRQEAPIYVTFNKLHNLLMLRSGDEKALAEARALVEKIDLPARQVMLEMRILQVRLDDEFHRAFDFDIFSNTLASGTATTSGSQPVNPLTGASTGPRALGAFGNYDLFDKNTGLFQFINDKVRLRLQLLEEKGRVQTLARPLLLASNNEPARLFIGEEVVLVTGASSQTTTGTTGASNTTITAETEKRNIGTTLVIHPRINADRTVTLTIDQENSERVVGGTTIPLATGTSTSGTRGILQFPIDTVNNATVQAVALAKDGLTIAIGGMIKTSRNRTDGNVPGLSSIPVLREIFKKDVRSDERYELVLVITPHVLESAEEGAQVTQRAGGQAVERAMAFKPQTSADAPEHEDAAAMQELARNALAQWQQEPGDWPRDSLYKRVNDTPWLQRQWPWEDSLARLYGAWERNGLTVVAFDLTTQTGMPLPTDAARWPGPWQALAIGPISTFGDPSGARTRKVVLVSKEPWSQVAKALQTTFP